MKKIIMSVLMLATMQASAQYVPSVPGLKCYPTTQAGGYGPIYLVPVLAPPPVTKEGSEKPERIYLWSD